MAYNLNNLGCAFGFFTHKLLFANRFRGNYGAGFSQLQGYCRSPSLEQTDGNGTKGFDNALHIHRWLESVF
jgi:hypothetical protein